MGGFRVILFRGWLLNHFLKHAVGAHPLLLLLDGHSSHFNPESIWFAKDHGVIVFCLPPHTTHESQPLGTCVFGPLKKNWSDVCHRFLQSHPGQVVTKYQFSSLPNEAWMMTMTPTNIVSGFRKCGVHPFNANTITAATIPTATTAKVQHETKESDNNPSFTADEETRFRTRYEERCDIFTPRYKLWLSIHHPEVITDGSVANAQNSLMDHFPVCDTRRSPRL